MEGKRRISKINILLISMLVICAISSIGLILVSKSEKQIELTGKSGNNIENNYATIEETTNTWDVSPNRDGSVIATLADDGTLTISGTGKMKNWGYASTDEWHNVRYNIKTVIIKEGVTSVGQFAFWSCKNLIDVEISNSVQSIGYNSFEQCENLANIKMSNVVRTIEKNTFYKCESLTNIEIPDTVMSIGEEAFFGCKSLMNINISSNVTDIGNDAFYGCESLISIEVEESNPNYFDDNGVLYTKDKIKIIKYPPQREGEEYKILDGVINIEESVFYNCKNLISIELPDSATSIGNYAFFGCKSLKNIVIPDSVTRMGYMSFRECTNLTNINIPKGLTCIESNIFVDCESLNNIEIPDSVTSIESSAFAGCKNLKNIKIPNSVTSIQLGAFARCESLTNIKIPSNITIIDHGTFQYCKRLTSVELPSGITSIGTYAFQGCTSLMRIDIPEEVTSIGMRAFEGCTNLTSINLPRNITNIGNNAFYNCMTINIIENDNVGLPTILQRAQVQNDILYSSEGFEISNCAIEGATVKMNEGVNYAKIKIKSGNLKGMTYVMLYNKWDISKNKDESIIATLTTDGILKISGTGEMVKENGSNVPWNYISKRIRKVQIQEGVTNIVSYAFSNCENLISIEIANSVINIGTGVFDGCTSLTSIEMPNSVMQIGKYAFYNCESLISIEIPDSVTSIGDRAFNGCTSLISIDVGESNPSYMDDNGVLYTKDKTKIIKYPEGKEDKEYKILSGVKNVEEYAFCNCYSLTSIKFPDSVTGIGTYTFYGCESLLSIEIPDKVISIGNGAFKECIGLESVKIPNSVITIGDSAFYGCQSLTNIEIPNNVTSIGDEAFAGCKSLQSIEIPNSVISIGDNAFYGCQSLESIKIPDNVTSIGEDALYVCWDVTVICKSGTTAETYAKENNINYQIDDVSPTIDSTESWLTTPVRNIQVEIKVRDNLSGVNEDNLRYIWSTKKDNITKEEIVNTLKNRSKLELKDVTGIYCLWIYAVDKVGNETISKIGEVNIDNIKPELKLNAQASIDKITVNVEAVDKESGINETSYKYYIKEENGTYSEGNSAGTNYTFENLKSNTKYKIKVEVSDQAGNTINQETEVTTTSKSNKITSTKQKVDEENKIIRAIKPKTTVQEIKKNLQSEMNYEIVDLEGKSVTDTTIIGTGFKVKMADGKEYTLIVWGDYTGDGKISIAELARASRVAVEEEEPELKEKMIIDVSMDGKIKVTDLAAISRLAIE